jgi:hypothetical protein
MHTARPAPKGQQELGVASGIIGEIDRPNYSVMPTVAEGQIRVSPHDRFDVGVRAYVTGIMFDVNWMFLDTGQIAVSLNPAIGGLLFSDPDDPDSGELWGYSTGWLSLLFDVLNRGSTTITTGPRAGFIVVTTSTGDDDDNVATYGPKVGLLGAMFAVRQRIGSRAAIMPEASIYVVNADPSYLAYSASLGVSFSR